MQDATTTKTTIRLFPSEESTFDNDMLSDDAKWQYYIASYEMSDHTEGVDLSLLRWPYLRRRLAHSKGSVEDTYSAVFGTLQNEDTQTVSISPDTYKMFCEGTFSFHREASGREKKRENDRFEDKLVKNPGWATEESEEAVNRRMAAWTRALKEDLSGYEAALARPAREFAQTGDVAMSEATV
jgi:paired amphipathic helix protein Sin3a